MNVYRGKYPTRIESSYGYQGLRMVRLNSGAVFSVSPINGKGPELGTDLADWRNAAGPCYSWEYQSRKRSSAKPSAFGLDGLTAEQIAAMQADWDARNEAAGERVMGAKPVAAPVIPFTAAETKQILEILKVEIPMPDVEKFWSFEELDSIEQRHVMLVCSHRPGPPVSAYAYRVIPGRIDVLRVLKTQCVRAANNVGWVRFV